MPRSSGKTLTMLSLRLVLGHYDDEHSFDEAARDLADYFYSRDRFELAEYVRTQMSDSLALSTMEPDPLSVIARDMYYELVACLGVENETTRKFHRRLSRYLSDFTE